MTNLAMQWTWHDQCGEGITESAVLAGIGIWLLLMVVVWAVDNYLRR